MQLDRVLLPRGRHELQNCTVTRHSTTSCTEFHAPQRGSLVGVRMPFLAFFAMSGKMVHMKVSQVSGGPPGKMTGEARLQKEDSDERAKHQAIT